jgi:uncharacterized membrane protein YphA (DoxX/SURF4 family)
MRSRTIARLGLAVLAAQGLLFGTWATISPRGYFDEFPGLGIRWVAVDGPYNEHLMRDYGALNLALGVFTLCAAVWLTRELAVAAALAWIVYAAPHVVYHALHRDPFGVGDQIGIVGGLLLQPVIALAVLIASRPAERPAGQVE